jgi:hypothetical protein
LNDFSYFFDELGHGNLLALAFRAAREGKDVLEARRLK